MIFPDFSSQKPPHLNGGKKKTRRLKKQVTRRFLTKELLEISFGLIQKISNHGQPEALNSDPDRMKECPRKPVGKIIEIFFFWHVVKTCTCVGHDVSI